MLTELVLQVVLYTFNEQTTYTIRPTLEINGTQVGEYFGAALTACDVTGDSLDDLVVGSPLFTIEYQEEGLVTVLYGSHTVSYVQLSSNIPSRIHEGLREQ